MRILIAIMILLIIAAGGMLWLVNGPGLKGGPSLAGPLEKLQEPVEKKPPFEAGERLIFDVYCKNINMGRSVLTFHGEKTFDGKDLYYITFDTDLRAFKDLEEIYAYKETFLPYKVFRTVKRFGAFSSKIEEYYDQGAFSVRIHKKRKFFPKEITIKKDGPIYNAILLPYYYRANLQDMLNVEFRAILPTSEFTVISSGMETMATPMGKKRVHVFAGSGSRFTFWLSAYGSKVPLKIQSHTRLDYSFVLNRVE